MGKVIHKQVGSGWAFTRARVRSVALHRRWTLVAVGWWRGRSKLWWKHVGMGRMMGSTRRPIGPGGKVWRWRHRVLWTRTWMMHGRHAHGWTLGRKGRVAIRWTHGNHFPHIPKMSLVFLLLVVGKFDNQWPGRAFHLVGVVHAFNGPHGRLGVQVL